MAGLVLPTIKVEIGFGGAGNTPYLVFDDTTRGKFNTGDHGCIASRAMEDLTKRQRDAFTQRAGESGDEWLARTMRTLRFRDLPRLMILRQGDRAQIEAIRAFIDLKMVVWTRALAFGTFALGICTIVAAIIVAS